MEKVLVFAMLGGGVVAASSIDPLLGMISLVVIGCAGLFSRQG